MKKALSLTYFSLIVTLMNLVLYDIPFFQFAFTNADMDFLPKALLMFTIVVVLFALTFMATYALMYASKRVGRIIICILQVTNAFALYFVITYHVVLDDTMMGNVFNTRYSEASGFFNWWLVGFVILLGVIPSVVICRLPIKKEKRKPKQLGKICGGTILLSVCLLLVNINQTLWIGRYDTELGGLLMPWSYIVNTVRMLNMRSHTNAEEIKLPEGKITDQKKTAVILVIGESARKANFQLYGYKRETNPMLSKVEDLNVMQAQSCATYTTAGVKAILEYKKSKKLYEILPNYASRTGVDVVWRTTNWGEPPVHVKDIQNKQTLQKVYPENKGNKYDEILLTGLRERIEKSDKSKVLIVLHTSTSHGPVYSEKYPKQFEKFTPVIDNVEQADKEIEKLVNAYDNSIIYTDYLLAKVIDTLKELEGWQTAMMFVSDHGESLGENNLFMHGVPMSMAPECQYEIPFLVWLSPEFRKVKVQGKALPEVIDQHYVFHSVLDLLSIISPIYNEETDIFTPLHLP